MNGNDSVNQDAFLEAFAAELAFAAYGVALRTRTEGTWLDLEVGLWRALAEKVKAWGQENRTDWIPPRGMDDPLVSIRACGSNLAIF